ncbi:DUF952 domain-containing protein [Segnochrobactrum spirostomi]|uniref:DUF952 domain-containing protein n=1 Tax=Segnochrobactrum spirostomi TaxID=2608987 RepID=A0A6A7Y1A3_9HYPH|nr:DUF952 domain-containing protein [Segnochrobactrum spirostomi]MQT12703.1 DUF952 domain-containing protein [Segnochrobactrum spirostomi]
MRESLIYKIAEAEAWAAAESLGRFDGAPIDLADGYIHFSTAAQLAETAAKHFAGRDGLVLVAVDADALGDALVYEPSRGGALFPHLYGPLLVSAVRSVRPIVRDADGRAILPEASA